MKRNDLLRGLLLIAVLSLFLSHISCEIIGDDVGVTNPTQTDIEGAKQKVTEANQALGEAVRNARQLDINDIEDLDNVTGFKAARDLYAEALILDPNNLDASLGYAVTQIILIKDDDEIIRLRDEWTDYIDNADITGPGVALFKTSPVISQQDLSLNGKTLASTLYYSATFFLQTPPLASEMQDAVRNIILPSFDIAVDRMNAIVESDSAENYTFIVSSQMQGGTPTQPEEPVELDLTDFKAFYASLLSSRAIFRIFLAYDLDVTSYDSSGFVEALRQDSDFFTLTDASEVNRAKADLLKASELVLEGITFLRSETDNQDDDFITVDPGEEEDALDEIETTVMDFRDALNGEVTITEDFDDDDATPDASLTISLKDFFATPPANPKQLLPSYMIESDPLEGDEFVWTAQSIDAWVFPDPTFSGLLPAMTDTLLKETFGMTFVPGDIDLSISADLVPQYSWNDSPIYHLRVERLSDFQTVWELHGNNFDNTIFSPVTHASIPVNAIQVVAPVPLISQQMYRIYIAREGGGPFVGYEHEVRDFKAQ
ncbi:MAG: hypothetical protein ACE5G1_11690 [bacterium]